MSILRSLTTKSNPLLNFQRCYRKPTASHIVNVDRPKRPSYFNSGSLYYEIAVPKDRDIVMDFMLKHFRVDVPFQKAVHATEEEVIDYYSDIVVPCLESGLTTLAFDGDTLKAIQLSRYVDIPSDNKQLFDFYDPSFAIKADYAEDIKNAPYKYEKANKMYVYLNALQRDFERIFPPNHRVYLMRSVSVSRDMRGHCVAEEMAYIGGRHSHDKIGCNSALMLAVNPKIIKLIEKQKHHRIARVFPFKDFKANGIPAFGDNFEGGGVLVCSDYETMPFMRYPTLYTNLFKMHKYTNMLKQKFKS